MDPITWTVLTLACVGLAVSLIKEGADTPPGRVREAVRPWVPRAFAGALDCASCFAWWAGLLGGAAAAVCLGDPTALLLPWVAYIATWALLTRGRPVVLGGESGCSGGGRGGRRAKADDAAKPSGAETAPTGSEGSSEGAGSGAG